MPSSIRRKVFDRDGHKCLACGSGDDITLDHIDPGGMLYSLSNLQTLCWDCNVTKGGKVIDYRTPS